MLVNFCILGVIKGSEISLQSEEGFMDREAYVNLSTRQQGTFAGRREIVYTLFEAYTKRRRERREWDAADRYICLPGLPCLFHDCMLAGLEHCFVY